MKIIQGFVNIPDLADNEKNKTAPFGEISPKSLTFSRTIKNFSDSANSPYVEIITFTSVNENSADIDVPAFVSRTAIQVGNWIYTQSKDGNIPAASNEAAFKQAILGDFQNLTNSYGLPTSMVSVDVGEILPIPSTPRLLVDWVSFVLKDDGDDYTVKLWFSDYKFQMQYTYYELVVLPPLVNIDTFNGTTPDVATLLSNITTNQVLAKINEVTEDKPATTTYTMPIRWHNPKNPTSTLETMWYVVVYGKAGIDNDAVKDAIRTYISLNTTITLWTSIFPDLYAESEFIFIPTWDQYSTPETGYDEGLYRSGITIRELNRLKRDKIPRSYNTVADFDTYMNDNLIMLSVPYRAMLCLCLGNPNNTQAKFNLFKIYNDYMNINPDSPDFNRLKTSTQQFIIKLSDALHKARAWGPSKPLPIGYSLSTKQNREYIGFDFEGYKYFIMTRHGYLKDSGEIGDNPL